MFKTFFEIDPQTVAMFNLHEVRDLYNSYELKRLAQKILKAFTHILNNFENTDGLKPLFQKLGSLHHTKNVTLDKYVAFGRAIVVTAEEILGDQMTAETRKAWECLYKVLSGHLQREQKSAQESESSELTPLQIRLVQSSWKMMQQDE